MLKLNNSSPAMRLGTKTIFFKVCRVPYGALMGLWAYGIRVVEIVLRIIERKIWQNNKGRKITS